MKLDVLYSSTKQELTLMTLLTGKYTKQLPSEYNYTLTDSIESYYERCLREARMMLGKSSMNTITHLWTLWNYAMNNTWTMLGKSPMNAIAHLQTLNDAMNDA